MSNLNAADFEREPTVGLHVHLEAAMDPDTIVHLAEKNHLTQATARDGKVIDGLDPQNPQSVRSFFAEMAKRGFFGPDAGAQFMKAYGLFSSLFKQPRDLTDATYGILANLQRAGTIHQELRTSPMSYLPGFGYASKDLQRMHKAEIVLGVKEVILAIAAGVDKAMKELGMSGAVIACFSRDKAVTERGKSWEVLTYDPLKNQGQYVVQAVSELNTEGHMVGLDIAGTADHERFSLTKFERVLRPAIEANVPITIHAGEGHFGDQDFRDAPPGEVRDAVEKLGARRIGHGLSIMKDRGVRDFLRERGIVIESCPVSNERMGLIGLRQHPLPNFIEGDGEGGLLMTIDTDDPLMFGVPDIRAMLRGVGGVLSLSVEDLRTMTVTAIQGAFLPEAQKRALMLKYRRSLPKS